METASLNWDSPENTVEAPQLDPYASVAPTATLPDDVIDKRSKKAQIAFSGESNPPSEDEIKTSIKSNRDDLLRQRLADSEAIRKQGVKQQIIREVVSSGDTSPDAVSFLQGLSADEIVQPQSILEKKYAEWRMNTALAEDDSGTVDKALATDPEGVHSRVDASVDRITRKELIQKHLEDLRAKHDQTGFGRTVIDFIADAIPLYTAVEDKSVYPKNVLAEGFMPGDYRMSANRDLFAMPIEELVSTLDKMSADADQSGDYAPTMKALEAALEYSNKAALTDNAFAILAATDLLPGGLTGDLLFGAGKAATTRGARVLAKKEALRKAQEAVLGAAQEGGSPKVAKAAGGLPNPPSVDSGIPAPGAAPMAPRISKPEAVATTPKAPPRDGSTPNQAVDTFNEQVSAEDLFGPGSTVSVDLSRVGEIHPLKNSGDYDIVGFSTDKGEVLLKDGSIEKVLKGGGTLWGKDGSQISLNAVAAFKNSGGKKWIIVRQPGQPAVVLPGVAQAPKPGPAVWSNAEHDVPVTILDEPPQPGNDGRMYQPVDAGEGKSYLPVDELKPAKSRSLREETVDPDGRRWPPAMGGPIDRTATTGMEGMSDKALKERYDYIQKKLYPDPNNPRGNGLSVTEQNKLVDELKKIEPEYDKRAITPGNSLYVPEEAAGPSDRQRIISIATTGKDPTVLDVPRLSPEEIVISAVAEKAAGSPKTLEELAKEIQDSYTIDGRVLPQRPGLQQEYDAALIARQIEDQKTGKVITSFSGNKYKITELGDEAMMNQRANGNNPLGFISMTTEKDGSHSIYINKEKISRAYKTKWWTQDSRATGFRALPADTFKSEEEFRRFVIEHEITHIDADAHTPWKTLTSNDKIVALEERVNANALVKMGKGDAAKKAYPEFFTGKVAGPDPAVVPAPPKIEEIVSDGKPFSKSNLPKKAGPKGEWVDPSARGSSRAPKEAPQYSVEIQKVQKEYQAARKKQTELANQIASPSRHFPDLNAAKLVKKLKELRAEKAAVDKELQRLKRVIDKAPKLNPAAELDDHIVVDIPNPRTGGEASVQIPATDENIVRVYADNIEKAALASNETDLANQFVAHGDNDRAALDMAANEVFGRDAVDSAETLARRLPSLVDPTAAVTGTAKHSGLYKLVLKEKERWKNVIARQAAVNESLGKVWDNASKGALRWSEQVFEAAKPAMREQMDKFIGTPSSAIKDISIDYLREFDTGLGRTNQIIYRMGTPDGQFFDSVAKANTFARDFYKLAPGTYSVELRTPTSYMLRVAKVIDETDPNILKHAIQTETKTPVSWVNTFMGYLRGSAGISSDFLQANLAASAHHAKALHDAFMVAAKDIGTLSKKEFNNLEALMEAKRDVEKTVYDPVSRQEKKVRGEWFESAADLERTYKRAFGEFPSENVVSAYFTMRQMYDFDLLYRNYRLYSQKSRLGIENAKLFIPMDDWKNPGMVKWVQMEKGVEAKFVDEIPAGKIADVLILDPETAQANLVNTGKSGLEGIKALREKGYKIMQLANPDQRPLRMVNDNYIQYVVAKDVERHPLTPDQLPATAGGHIRYKEGFFVKQPRYEVTSNGQKLYLGDRSILGASSSAEAAKHAAAMEKGRQLLVAGDMQGLKEHLKNNLPWTVGQFENLFMPKLGNKGNVIEEAALDKSTPITWVADGQGTNDAAKTHAAELRSHFEGVRDTIDDDTNLYRVLDKKFTGEKDLSLQKIVQGDNGPLWKFDKARMVSPMETLEQAWAEVSRSMATDNLKIQAMTNWVEEAADVLQTPIEELRKNPWEALNNPQWNRQYADVARVRTLDAQRRQIIAFLGQKDALGSTLDWMRNKLMDSVFDKKGGAAADWVDDHLLPNVKNPLSFMRSFAFHAKMGFFNPIQLFLQSATMVNTFAITGNPARVGSALSGVMLMHTARVNRTPEILEYLAKKSEKLGWKPGEWLEMEKTFRDLSLHLVEGEVGTLAVMTNPSVYKSKLGMALDKGLVFFREAERNVRANAWAVAYKEFRDANPTKVLTYEDINKILRRQEILSGNMTRGSNALWQHGLTGPMTQFWGYQARITEQLLGKQLTKGERLRLGLSMAAMYGIPVSIGAGTFMQIPGASTDDIRQYAQDHGIDVNSGLASVAMNGIPAEVIRWATSDENGQNGLLFNIGDRYGPGGLPVLKNLVEAKDGMVDAVVDLTFGASGSIFRDFAKHMLPDSWDVLESATNAPNLTLNDFAGMFSTVSTVSNTTKLLWALQTHKAYTRDGLELGDKSVASAFVSFTTGLDEQWVKDTMLKMDSMKDLKAANDELKKEYIKQIRAAMQLPSGSPEREARIKKARGLAIGIDPNEFKKWVKDSVRPAGSLKESVDKQYEKKVLSR